MEIWNVILLLSILLNIGLAVLCISFQSETSRLHGENSQLRQSMQEWKGHAIRMFMEKGDRK